MLSVSLLLRNSCSSYGNGGVFPIKGHCSTFSHLFAYRTLIAVFRSINSCQDSLPLRSRCNYPLTTRNKRIRSKSRYIKRCYFLIPYWFFSTDPILEKVSASIQNALGNTSSLVSLGRHFMAALSCLRFSVARNAATRQCTLNTSLHSRGRFPSSKAANKSLIIPTRSTRPMATYPG